VLDTHGNGRLDEWNEPGKPADQARDTRFNPGSGPYAVMPHPRDGSIWYTSGTFGGRAGFLRFDPATRLSEFYAIPKEALGIRGGDIDLDGVLWASMSSGHLGRFDRRLCKGPLNGPSATGDHCPEGWSLHRYPGPGFIDDPAAGWKGRGLWSTSGDRTPWLMEGGKGSRPRAVQIQVRPDPLAR